MFLLMSYPPSNNQQSLNVAVGGLRFPPPSDGRLHRPLGQQRIILGPQLLIDGRRVASDFVCDVQHLRLLEVAFGNQPSVLDRRVFQTWNDYEKSS